MNVAIPTLEAAPPGEVLTAPPNIVNITRPEGDYNLTPVTGAPRVVHSFTEQSVKMTGKPVVLSDRSILFRKALFYGIAAFNGPGVAPTPNQNVVYLGYSGLFLPIQIATYAGGWSYSVEAPLGHVYDLSSFWAAGTAGDWIFSTLE